MRIAAFGKQFHGSARRVAPVLLTLLLSVVAWPGQAQAEFTCASNADCADTAIGCGDGHCGPSCYDGVCAPQDPDSDNIGCILVPNDSKCDDGDFCNGAEFCNNNGGCEDAPPPTCDDQLPCTLDSCDAGANACSHVPRNSLCNDGLFCDGVEICDPTDGCINGTPPRCGDGIACTVDSCSEDTDSCIHSPNNAACSDGVFCDGAEICNVFEGCVEATRPACDDGFACTGDTCNEANDTCGHTANNALCDNGQFCDGSETCSLSQGCVAGTAPNCADAVACTTDACNEATDSCTHSANNAACSNGTFCDGVEVCNVTQGCQAGTPVNCADNFSCTADSCNEAADRCDHATNDSLCNNGLYCDGVETCSAAQGCVNGAAPNCADAVSCTVDTCVEATDSCAHTPSNDLCSDGLFCDGVETCNALKGCQAGTPPNCTDKFACTGDSCNEATDSCQFQPHDSACSNGLFCDGAEVCVVGKGCQPGTRACNDGVSCTDDNCVESSDSCIHTPYDTLCSNGKFCDGEETCNSKLDCQPGTPVDCSDQVACTTDRCVESTDTCSHSPSNAACSDGLFCNGAEICDVLIGCHLGLPPPCADNVDCTVDTCVEETDTCQNAPSNELCSNGLFCDGTETCSPTLGCQDAPAPDCADDIECTVDSCSEAAKSCVNAPDNAACSNGLFCDGNEVCNPAMGCQAGSAPNCGDALSCTDDSCFEGADMCLNVPNFNLCGNGVVDAACSEECDADNGEICNNDIDDDNDQLIDCADPDCEEKTEPTCDDNCQLVPPCRVLLRDPAVISWGGTDRAAGSPGVFSFHARLIPTTPVDPAAEGFVVTLANANGVIFRADVKAVDISATQRRYVYRAADAAAVARNGGVLRLSIVRRVYQGEVGYGFRVKAMGDFSAATLARMTTQVYFGDDVGYVTANWRGEPGHWVLHQRDYDDGTR